MIELSYCVGLSSFFEYAEEVLPTKLPLEVLLYVIYAISMLGQTIAISQTLPNAKMTIRHEIQLGLIRNNKPQFTEEK